MTIEKQNRLNAWVPGILYGITSLLPAIALYILWRWLPDTRWLRWSALLGGMGILLAISRVFWSRLSLPERISLCLVSVAAPMMIMSYLQDVTNYPFKLSWSEGNRFYDYSQIFGEYLYHSNTPLKLLYNEPGRYALWGILFAIPGLPIWVHRLWNAVLFTVPLLLIGFLLSRWLPSSGLKRWHFVLWVFLFLIQGPIYASLVVSAILVLVSVRWKSLWFKALIVFVAGFYAVISRWTWLPAAGVWAGMLVLLWDEYNPISDQWGWLPVRKQRFIEAAILSLAGFAGGVLAKPDLFFATKQATGFALQQPLLLYRLLPNATYKPGILLAFALSAAPLALLLVWLILKRAWRLSWFQMVVAALPAIVFAAMGIVASTKIGGGGNLHNLDMFYITMSILSALALKSLEAKGVGILGSFSVPWRALALGLVGLAVLIPAWNAFQSGSPVHLPDQQVVESALSEVQAAVDQAQPLGEVLFMDHRQLLTFGYIHGVTLVPEYEMKYMMDQSMSGDASRFRQFYSDLANQRFKLIVVHPLESGYQGPSHNFGDENDAWVKWVAEPLLCYYRPDVTIKEVNLLLMTPRALPKGNCP